VRSFSLHFYVDFRFLVWRDPHTLATSNVFLQNARIGPLQIQPDSIAMSVYRHGTTKFSAKVPSESAWSRRNSAGLLFKSTGARTILTPGAGLCFLRATPVTRPFPFEALIVTLTSWAVAISKERPEVFALAEVKFRMKSPCG